MSGIWAISFDESGAMLKSSGNEKTYMSEDAMRFPRQEDALAYLDQNRSVIEALGKNPIPSKHRQ